jgi:hypothetical protein
MDTNITPINRPRITPSLKYTDGQQKATDQLADWFDSRDRSDLFRTLAGAAGTGKTTLLRDFLNYTRRFGSITVTATTHKAVHIVSQITGVKGSTIQKLCGLRPNTNLENFDINRVAFESLGRKYIADYKLVIIDEASQLNTSLKELIERDANQFIVKVLYVGDQYQLPPVGEKESSVFKMPHVITLTEIVRQEKGNPLLELLGVVRDDVKYSTNKFIGYLHCNPTRENDKGQGYYSYSTNDFANVAINMFKSNRFTNDINYCRFTAFTNQNILEWNNYIRKQIYPTVDKIICEDDLLISYNTILDEFNAPITTNSSDYTIEEIVEYINSFGIAGYLVKLKDILANCITPYVFIVDHTNTEAFERFMFHFNNFLTTAKNASAATRSRAWKDYYAFKEKNLLLANVTDNISGTLIVGKDLDYGYGITTHKTQGSTYTNIMINLNNMLYNKYGVPYTDKRLITRLLYVALSRAKEKAIILT